MFGFDKKKSDISQKELDHFIKKATIRLEEKVSDLEKTKVGLEKKVEERTMELEKRARDLEEIRKALMNMLEDVEEARALAIKERDKTLAVILNFTDGLIIFDKNGIITMINPKLEEMFDVKEKEIKGKSIEYLKNENLFVPIIDSILKKGKIRKIKKKEFIIKKDITIEMTIISLKEGKKEIGFLCIFHNISREKIVEKLKTEFVSLAAHQLRTPLSAIKWTLKMLLDGDIGKITKEQRGFVEKTYISNERMISLINDLLNITRIEEGRYLHNPVFANIEDEIKYVVDSYKHEIEIRNINLIFKKSNNKLSKVMIDVEKIRLAIQNLIDNAIKYTKKEGNVTITVKYVKKEVEVCVKDNGVGIPKDQQKRVFTKFFRAANVMKIETEGSGLGLYITKNIIEANKGRIWFKSEENKGTSLCFALPVKV